MRPKSPFVPLCGLLLAVVLGATLLSGPGEAAQKPTLAAPVTPSGKKAVVYVLERIRRTGSFNHPAYPLVVRARCVRGDTLYFVDFLHRRADGPGFDVVGKAVQATLTFSEECEPIRWPWDVIFSSEEDAEPGPVRRDTLRADVWQLMMRLEEGSLFYQQYHTLDLALPTKLRKEGFRSFAAAAAQLSPEQHEALAKEFTLSPEQKRLIAAFGEECYDLLGACVVSSESGRRVIACTCEPGKGVEHDSDSRFKVRSIAVAQFDRTGKVLTRFRGSDISVDEKDYFDLLVGDESKDVTLRGPDGSKFILPAARADP